MIRRTAIRHRRRHTAIGLNEWHQRERERKRQNIINSDGVNSGAVYTMRQSAERCRSTIRLENGNANSTDRQRAGATSNGLSDRRKQ